MKHDENDRTTGILIIINMGRHDKNLKKEYENFRKWLGSRGYWTITKDIYISGFRRDMGNNFFEREEEIISNKMPIFGQIKLFKTSHMVGIGGEMPAYIKKQREEETERRNSSNET